MIDYKDARVGLSEINAAYKRNNTKYEDVKKELKEQDGYQLNYTNTKINYFSLWVSLMVVGNLI